MIVKLLGLSEVLSRITAVNVAADRASEGASKALADQIASRAQALAPVRTGALRSSIGVEPGDRVTLVITRIPYSLYQEFGTVHMAPRSFMRPAVDEASTTGLNIIRRIFGTIFR